MGYIRLLFLLAILGITTVRSKPEPQFTVFNFQVAQGGIPINPIPEAECQRNLEKRFRRGGCVQAGTVAGPCIYSRVQKRIENWSVWSKMALGEVGVSLP